MDRPVGERHGKRVVHQAMLLDERETVEAGARHGHLEVVAAAGAILDGEPARIGEGLAQERLERLGGGHGTIVAPRLDLPGGMRSALVR